MNKITNKFVSTEDKLLPELQLKQQGLTYSVCGPFFKHHKRIQKFRKAGNLKRF